MEGESETDTELGNFFISEITQKKKKFPGENTF